MKNLSFDYSEITADPVKPNFIKAHLNKSLSRTKTQVSKKFLIKPKELIFETLPPIDNDPNLTRHRSNIIRSKILQDSLPSIKAEDSRDVSCYLDSKIEGPFDQIHKNIEKELFVLIGVKEPSPVFTMPTDLAVLKSQVTKQDLLLWSLKNTKDIDFSYFATDLVKTGMLKAPQSLNFGELGAPSKRKEAELLSN